MHTISLFLGVTDMHTRRPQGTLMAKPKNQSDVQNITITRAAVTPAASLPLKSLHKLQLVQNSAACVHCVHHITPILLQLLQLPSNTVHSNTLLQTVDLALWW